MCAPSSVICAARRTAGFSSLRNAIESRFAAADAKVTWVIGIQVGMLLMILRSGSRVLLQMSDNKFAL